jgi:hypothetical protein
LSRSRPCRFPDDTNLGVNLGAIANSQNHAYQRFDRLVLLLVTRAT